MLIILVVFFVSIALLNPEIGFNLHKQFLYISVTLLELNKGEMVLIFLFVISAIYLFFKRKYDKTKNIRSAILYSLVIVLVLIASSILLFVNGDNLKKIQNDEKVEAKRALRANQIDIGAKALYSYPIPDQPNFSYVADFAKDDILLGSSHNVFIGRVIKQEGIKSRFATPETQFKVEVISNIKGDLRGTVTVDQFGGYKNGVLYTVSDDNPDPKANNSDSYLLQEGNTYLLATRYNETEDWYTLNSFYTAKKLLSTDKNMNPSDLKALADSDERVKALKEAYPKEKLLDADISHGNTKNSFVSLSVEDQEKIKNELKTIE